jgi:hypothetical protein
MEYLELFKVIVATLFTGAGIGLMAYFSKAQKGEAFEPLKLAKTGFIGAVVGLIMYLSGQEMDASNYQAYIAANAGVIYALDKLWSFLRNAFKARFSGIPPVVGTMLVCIVFLSSGCAGIGGNTVTPKTDGEKLAYAEATLTGITIIATRLNEAKLLSLEEVKSIERGITKAELTIWLGRIALLGKDAKTVEAQIALVQEVLTELTSFIEDKRVDYSARPLPPLPEEGLPKPIENEVH